jgi:hypothetical protein
MVDSNNQKERTIPNTNENSKAREVILDHVSPFLEPLYEIFIEDFVNKYDIQLPVSFFFFIGMFIFSVILICFNLNFSGAILLLLLALLILVAKNRKLIINVIIKRIRFNKGELVDNFIAKINEKGLDETIKFILKNSNELTSNDLILLMQSKFYDNASFHRAILKSQIIESELLEYMINNDLDPKIGGDIFSDYLKYCYNAISHASYDKLAARHKNSPNVIQILNACFPVYLKNHPIFKFFANLRIQIKESIRYGNSKRYIFYFWIFIAFSALLSQKITMPTISQIPSSDQTTHVVLNAIMLINFGISLLLAIAICSAISLYVILWSMRRYRTLLCFFAPNNIE